MSRRSLSPAHPFSQTDARRRTAGDIRCTGLPRAEETPPRTPCTRRNPQPLPSRPLYYTLSIREESLRAVVKVPPHSIESEVFADAVQIIETKDRTIEHAPPVLALGEPEIHYPEIL